MLRASAALVLALLSPAIAFAAPDEFADAVLSEGPVAYWRFDEPEGSNVAEDRSGNGNLGQYAGEIALGAPSEGGDQGGLFMNGRMTVNYDPALDLSTGLTIHAVVTVTSTETEQARIVEKSTERANVVAHYGLSFTADEHLLLEANVNGEPVRLVSSERFPLGVPVMISATYDGDQLRLFVDGSTDSSTAAPGTLGAQTQQGLAIGNQDQRERPFSGLIDEVAIFDRALEPIKIIDHYNAMTGRPRIDGGVIDAGAPDAGVVPSSDAGELGEALPLPTVDSSCGCSGTPQSGQQPADTSLAILIATAGLIPIRKRRR